MSHWLETRHLTKDFALEDWFEKWPSKMVKVLQISHTSVGFYPGVTILKSLASVDKTVFGEKFTVYLWGLQVATIRDKRTSSYELNPSFIHEPNIIHKNK